MQVGLVDQHIQINISTNVGRYRKKCHVERMNEEKKPKKFLEYRPLGKRPLGRPRKRWIEGVDKALEERGTSIKEVQESKK